MSYDLVAHKIYCPNCSSMIYGYCNDDGIIKFSCSRCGYSRASKKAGRYKLKTDEFFPRGGSFYGEERDYIPEDDDLFV